jgi:hypothetical protein
MSWWTTEQVTEYLGITRQAVYDSRARDKFPGNRGSRKSSGDLRFPSEAIEQGKALVDAGENPDRPETTDDGTTAILWALEGIHKTLRAIHTELRKPQNRAEAYVDMWTATGEEE